MRIDELIQELEEVREEHGNLETNVNRSLNGCVTRDTLFINRQIHVTKGLTESGTKENSNLGTPSKNNIEFL